MTLVATPRKRNSALVNLVPIATDFKSGCAASVRVERNQQPRRVCACWYCLLALCLLSELTTSAKGSWLYPELDAVQGSEQIQRLDWSFGPEDVSWLVGWLSEPRDSQSVTGRAPECTNNCGAWRRLTGMADSEFFFLA